MQTTSPDPPKKSRSSTGRLPRFFFGAALVLLVAEIFLLLSHDRHSYFTLDWGWAFYAALGFFGSITLLFLSRGFGNLLRHPEDPVDEPVPEDLDERIR